MSWKEVREGEEEKRLERCMDSAMWNSTYDTEGPESQRALCYANRHCRSPFALLEFGEMEFPWDLTSPTHKIKTNSNDKLLVPALITPARVEKGFTRVVVADTSVQGYACFRRFMACVHFWGSI